MSEAAKQVTVGDEVIVIVPYRNRSETVPAIVTKAARVNLEITKKLSDTASYPTVWKMRRDLQSEPWNDNTPGGGTYQASYMLPEEYAAQEREREASMWLKEQGIDVAYVSPWADRRHELMNIIKRAESA